MNKLLTIEETAAKLRVSANSVRNMVKNGRLPEVRLGYPRGAVRFDPKDVEKLIKRRND